MGTGLGGVAVLEAVIIVVLDRVLILIQWERPEAIKVDLIAEACGQGVHQEAGGWSFDVDFVGQPISGEEKKVRKGTIKPGKMAQLVNSWLESMRTCLEYPCKSRWSIPVTLPCRGPVETGRFLELIGHPA